MSGLKCGRANYYYQDCYTDCYSLRCNLCSKVGHVSKVCITTLIQKKNAKSAENTNLLCNSANYHTYNAYSYFDTNQLETVSENNFNVINFKNVSSYSDEYFAHGRLREN